jgi:hypothetical protein
MHAISLHGYAFARHDLLSPSSPRPYAKTASRVSLRDKDHRKFVLRQLEVATRILIAAHSKRRRGVDFLGFMISVARRPPASCFPSFCWQ